MNRRVGELPNCPVETTLLLIGTKWKVLSVRELRGRTLRFSELKAAVEGISQKVLTANLRSMEEGVRVVRQAFAEVPPRVEYSLTPSGRAWARCATAWTNGAPATAPRSPRRPGPDPRSAPWVTM